MNPPLRPQVPEVRLQSRLIRMRSAQVVAELEALAHAKHPDDIVKCYRRLLREMTDLHRALDHAAFTLGLPLDEALIDDIIDQED